MIKVTLEFGKEKTAILKGIAILMMIVLHCCCGPQWYDTTIPALENPCFVSFMNRTLKICVGIYAFLVGFGYSFSRNRDWKYSLTHIWKLLLPYWIILFGLSLPFGANSMGGATEVLLNMFGISRSLSWVNWFVYFYIFQMVFLPFLTRLIDLKPYLLTGVCMMGFLGVKACMQIVHLESNVWTDALSACCICSPIVLLGYLFGRERLFTRVSLPVSWPMTVAACLVVIAVPVIRSLGYSFITEWVLVPVFIIAILYLFSAYKLPFVSKVLSAFGNNSVYMWFFHGLFFTLSVRWFWQRFILISDNIIIITLCTIMLTFACSWVLKKGVGSLTK